MTDLGIRYTVPSLGSLAAMDQRSKETFQLSISGGNEGLFSTASQARRKIVDVIEAQTGKDFASSQRDVPTLRNWTTVMTAPFDSEER